MKSKPNAGLYVLLIVLGMGYYSAGALALREEFFGAGRYAARRSNSAMTAKPSQVFRKEATIQRGLSPANQRGCRSPARGIGHSNDANQLFCIIEIQVQAPLAQQDGQRRTADTEALCNGGFGQSLHVPPLRLPGKAKVVITGPGADDGRGRDQNP